MQVCKHVQSQMKNSCLENARYGDLIRLNSLSWLWKFDKNYALNMQEQQHHPGDLFVFLFSLNKKIYLLFNNEIRFIDMGSYSFIFLTSFELVSDIKY